MQSRPATPKYQAKGNSTLINRNVSLGGRRTSFRFEQGMWDALDEICLREAVGLGALFERIDQRRLESSLTAAIRVYILSYFRSATTEAAHAAAGHGRLRGGVRVGAGSGNG